MVGTNGVPPHDKLQHDDDFYVALLHLAVKEDDLLAIKDLMRVPTWIHAADKGGRNALHWSVAFGSKGAWELLLPHTSEDGVHHADKIGRTPLHFAAIWGRSDVAKMILARGAHINASDRKGMTALHYAAQNSNPFLIRSLIKRGADKQARDSKRRIPYQIAVQWGGPREILDLLDPDFNPRKAQIAPDMPQARRFAALLSPKGHQEVIPSVPPSNSNKDFPAELVKFEMQKQSDKTLNSIRKVVVKKMKKWEPPEGSSKEFALKALAARRRKMFVEHQMKKTQEMKRLQQIKKPRKGARSVKSSSRSSPSVRTPSPKARKANTEVSSPKASTISRSGSKTATETKSSRSSSPAAFRGASKRMTPPTFSRPNSPHSYMSSSSPKPVRPNPTARDGWPSSPGSIGGGRDGRRDPLTQENKGKDTKEVALPKPKWPMRTPSPSRLALSEFVGTSARHNSLGKYPSPAVHQCIDVQKLQNQWL